MSNEEDEPAFVGLRDEILHQWRRSVRRERVLLTRGWYRGAEFFDLRVWYPIGDDKFMPGKGIRLREEELPRLSRCVEILKRLRQ